jgi:hypothetical protein
MRKVALPHLVNLRDARRNWHDDQAQRPRPSRKTLNIREDATQAARRPPAAAARASCERHRNPTSPAPGGASHRNPTDETALLAPGPLATVATAQSAPLPHQPLPAAVSPEPPDITIYGWSIGTACWWFNSRRYRHRAQRSFFATRSFLCPVADNKLRVVNN